ncbi:MAG: recombinase family protein [bacterium]|nr:recombinase family protein [bacterium]
MYVKDISNKLRSSLYVKKRNGQFVGAYAPFGYNKSDDDKHKLVINEEEALVVRRIFNMFKNGLSLSKICDILTKEGIPTPSISKNMNIGQNNLHYGVWSTRTVNDILKCPTYIGNLTQCKQRKVSYKSKKVVHNKQNNWIVANNAVPAIIDEETFDLVANMFKSNKNKGLNNGITDKLLLRGLIFL